MRKIKNYTFVADDDWGYYIDGTYHKGYINKSGYNIFSPINENGEHYNEYIHRAKWEYFNGKIPEGYEIDHIIPVRNGGTNKLSNLRLVTHKENMNNKITLETFSKWERTDEMKKNMSESGKGKHSGEKNGMFNRQHSVESKEKISKSKQKPIIQVFHDGSIKLWKSASECARNGYSQGCVSACCRNEYTKKRTNVYKNCKWYFEDEYKKMLLEKN